MKAAPRYSQIISYYRSLIESGKLAEGDKMPTEETIGEIFGVSRITVRQALDGLAQSGYIYKIIPYKQYRKKTDISNCH